MLQLPPALRVRALGSTLFATHASSSSFIRPASFGSQRLLSTLPNNPHIYIHPPSPASSKKQHTLTLLPTSPPTTPLILGTTTDIPPTPNSFTPNPSFLPYIHDTIRRHAAQDPTILASAAAYASTAGSALGSGGAFFEGGVKPQPRRRRSSSSSSSNTHTHNTTSASGAGYMSAHSGAGGASAQGGAGGGGRGGWVHVSDLRNVPDYGRIAWPEDIFGSVEVDGEGNIILEKNGDGEQVVVYQESGTYRICTREGILGLSDYIMQKLVDRLKAEERKIKQGEGQS